MWTPDTNTDPLAMSTTAATAQPCTAADFLRSAASAADNGREWLAGQLAEIAADMLTGRAGLARW